MASAQLFGQLAVDVRRPLASGRRYGAAQMARAARVASIGVTWGYHSRDVLLAERPTAMIERFADLPDVADRVVSSQAGR